MFHILLSMKAERQEKLIPFLNSIHQESYFLFPTYFLRLKETSFYPSVEALDPLVSSSIIKFAESYLRKLTFLTVLITRTRNTTPQFRSTT